MKLFCAILILVISSVTFAESSCERLFEKKLEEIAKEVDYQENTGGQFIRNPYSGQIGYTPGPRVTHVGPNWARDFLYAIKYGPEVGTFTLTKGRSAEFLKNMAQALSKECKLRDDPDFKNLRLHLKSLITNGSFCPNGVILKPNFFGSYKKFHQVSLRALKESDDFGLCDRSVVSDDSHRSIKDISSPLRAKEQKNSAKHN